MSQNDDELIEALADLRKLGKSGATRYVDLVAQAARKKNPNVRAAAAAALSLTDPALPVVIRTYSALMDDNETNVLVATLRSFVSLKVGLEKQSPDVFGKKIERLLHHKNPYVNINAAGVLMQMAPGDRAPVAQLQKMLEDPSDGVQCEAVKVLASGGKRIVPLLATAVGCASARYRINFISILGLIGIEDKEAAKEILPHLLAFTRDADMDVRSHAEVVLQLVEQRRRTCGITD
jgi:HEAT repeat protein